MPNFNPSELKARANRARALLADDLLREVFEAAEKDALGEILNQTDPTLRDRSWHRYHATREARNRLDAIVAEGGVV